MDLIIKNAAVNGCTALKDVYVEHGAVVKIEDSGEKRGEYRLANAIDAEGHMLLPGFIDMNCDVCDPGYENRESIASVTRSAAKGGFTSITCLPVTNPPIDNKAVVQYILSKSKSEALVNVLPYGHMTKEGAGKEMAEIGGMRRAGAVAVSDGNRPVGDAWLLKNIMLYSLMFDVPVITFCENKMLTKNGVMNEGRVSARTGLSGAPKDAEETAVAINLVLAANTKAKLHITHVSTKTAVELIRYAKSRGVGVTCDTCPHYFTLDDSMLFDYDTFLKVNPPLRTGEDVAAIKRGLKDGTIDAIASGHSPASLESKLVEFDRAATGISSVETAFAVSYTELVQNGDMTVKELSDKFAFNPAAVLGLKNKGAVAPGCDADFTILKTDAAHTIDPSEFASKAKYSPYKGRTVGVRTLYTIVNGKIVYIAD